MAGSTKVKPGTASNTHGKTVTITERTSEILRRVSFARNYPIKVLIEELTEQLAVEAQLVARATLPKASYDHETE
jgi:hypothetical protein